MKKEKQDVFDMTTNDRISNNVRRLKKQTDDLNLQRFATKQDVTFALEEINLIKITLENLILDLVHVGMWEVPEG